MVSLMEYFVEQNFHKYVIPNDMTNGDQKCELSVLTVNFQIKQLRDSIFHNTGKDSNVS